MAVCVALLTGMPEVPSLGDALALALDEAVHTHVEGG